MEIFWKYFGDILEINFPNCKRGPAFPVLKAYENYSENYSPSFPATTKTAVTHKLKENYTQKSNYF